MVPETGASRHTELPPPSAEPEVSDWISSELDSLQLQLSGSELGPSLADGGILTDGFVEALPNVDWDSALAGTFLQSLRLGPRNEQLLRVVGWTQAIDPAGEVAFGKSCGWHVLDISKAGFTGERDHFRRGKEADEGCAV